MADSSSSSARTEVDQDTISERIIGAAYKVYNTLGYGFLEAIYERCILKEIRKLGLHVDSQLPVPVYYDGEKVGLYTADLLVDSQIIVELKSVERLARAHEVQLVNYLKATGKPTGFLINFGPTKVEVRRKFREYIGNKPSPHPVDPANPVILSPPDQERAE